MASPFAPENIKKSIDKVDSENAKAGALKPKQRSFMSKGDIPSIAGLIAGQGADLLTTQRFLHNGSGCVESNSHLGPNPSFGDLAKTKLLGVGALEGLASALRLAGKHADSNTGSNLAKWGARGLELALAGTGARSAIRNTQQCGF